MKRNVYFLIYDKFADFEIVQAALLLRDFNRITVSFKEKMYTSETGFKVLSDMKISEVNPDETALFIIPGGEPKYLIKDPKYEKEIRELNELLINLHEKNVNIAAICGGPTFLANSGVLNGKNCTGSIKDDEKQYYEDTVFHDCDIIRDGHLLTAKGNAFTEFAIEIGRIMNVFENEQDAIETLQWFKNIKDIKQ